MFNLPPADARDRYHVPWTQCIAALRDQIARLEFELTGLSPPCPTQRVPAPTRPFRGRGEAGFSCGAVSIGTLSPCPAGYLCIILVLSRMTPVSWWLVFLPSILIALAFVLLNWLLWRKRSLRDWKRLRHAATMPPEHVAAEPRRAKDLAIGGQGFVGSYDVVASEKDHRAYVAWDARLVEPPKDPDDQFAPLRIRRLEGGFSLTVRVSNSAPAPCRGACMRR
jgi:hypothetical protein